MVDPDRMLKRQQVLADFGELAIRSDDIDHLLSEACRLVAEGLGAGRAKILEVRREERVLLVRAGVGWRPDIVGRLRMPLDEPSSETFAIGRAEPVVTPDVALETRFDVPGFMREEGVVALVNVPILLPGRGPFGLLQVDDTRPRDFGGDEIQFLRTYANILGPVIDRLLVVRELRAVEERQAFLLRLSDALRPIADPAAIQETASRMAAEHLDIGRVAYCEVRREPDIMVHVERDWPRRGMPSLAVGRYRLDDFGTFLAEALTAGRPAIVADAESDPRLSRPERENWAAHAIRASCALPLLKEGRFAAYLVAQDDRQRDWTEAEIALLGEVSERVWAAVGRARAEAALREGEERLRLAFEVGGLGSWDWDLTTGAVKWSEEHWRMQGYHPGELEPNYAVWAARVHPDDLPAAEEALGRALGDGTLFASEFRYLWPDGTVRWCAARGQAFRDAAGRAVRMVGVTQDVTERREAEERLRESEARLAAVFAQAAVGLSEIAPDGRFVSVNDELCRLLGRPREELLRLSVAEVTHPDDVPPSIEALRRAGGGDERASLDKRYRRPDGTLVWAISTITRLRDAEGRPGNFLVVTADLTARRAAEDALRRSEQRFRALATAGSALLYRMSPDWRQMFELSGRGMLTDTPEPIEGWADKYLLPEDRPAILARIDEAIRTRSVFEMEHRVRTADGAVGWVQSRAVPILGPDGAVTDWFGVGRDVTAHREMQERLREREASHRAELERQVRERTAELRESRDLLRATMDASTDMIQVFQAVRDGEGRITDFRWVLVNHEAESRLGKVAGDSLLARNPGVVAEGILDAFRRVAETGVPEQAERRYAHEQFDGWFLQSVVRLGDGVATTTKEITAWKAAQEDLLRLREEIAQAKLRESEERFRLLVASVRDHAIFTIDRKGIVTSWPPGAAAVFGWPEEEIVGRPVDVTFVPEDIATDEPRKERETALREGVAPNVRYHLRKDGARIFIDGSTQPLAGADGEVREFIKIGQDVTQARRAQEALAEGEERLRTLMEGIPQLVWRSGDAGRWTWSSPQWQAFTGQRLEASLGLGWLDAVHPDDRDAALEAWRGAAVAGGLDSEFRVRRARDGAWLWHRTRALPVRDGGGRVVEWLGTATDVQQLKELQERQEVLVAELQHRTRNLIAVVRSIARQTMARTGPTEAFREEFNHRLEALARVQGLLSRAEEEPITMEGLIRMELDALGAEAGQGRVHVGGPAVRIRPSVVQTLALALHELATNARKYGALSTEGGRLEIQWRTYSDVSSERVALEWVESGGRPPDPNGEVRRGYGRELIERALPYSLDARTSFEHDAAGLRCTIDMPLGRRPGRSAAP